MILCGVPYVPGIPQEAMPTPFGFTGELHDAGLVSLRARWYNPTSGVFLSRDPFGGFATRPYSLHPYQYGYANPVVWTDASGRCVGWLWNDPTCTFAGYNPRDWSWNESLDTWQVGLDVAGMVPVLSEPTDALNTGISLARGDCVGAGLSLAAMLPVAGWGATAGKVGRRGLSHADELADLARWEDDGGRVLDDVLTPSERGPVVSRGSGGSTKSGRSGKQARLRALMNDPHVSSADRGWIKQEINAIRRGKRKTIRVPPGKVLSHRRGFEARTGFGYDYSDLQDIELHMLQHRHEGYK